MLSPKISFFRAPLTLFMPIFNEKKHDLNNLLINKKYKKNVLATYDGFGKNVKGVVTHDPLFYKLYNNDIFNTP